VELKNTYLFYLKPIYLSAIDYIACREVIGALKNPSKRHPIALIIGAFMARVAVPLVCYL
jgi:hypothetical protein